MMIGVWHRSRLGFGGVLSLTMLATMAGLATPVACADDEVGELVTEEVAVTEVLSLGNSKSTLETITLRSLESDDLADAGIPGSLEAPAAGESVEIPEELGRVRKDLEPRDTQEDLGRFNVPAQFINRPDPMAVEGRTYNYDYIYRTER